MFTYKTSTLLNDFDKMIDNALEVVDSLSFPPYDSYVKDGKNIIEMAVAGYPKDSINIKVEGSYLVVEGAKQPSPVEDNKFYHKGVSRKAFKARFKLSSTLDNIDAEYNNGILVISLESKNKSSFNVEIK